MLRLVQKSIVFFAFPAILLLISLGSLHYASIHQIFDDKAVTPIAFDKYELNKTEGW